MASSPRFPLPFITHKNQPLFHDFLHFHLQTNLTSDSDTSSSDDEAHTMDTLLTAAIHVASQSDNTTKLAIDETRSNNGLSDILEESSEELSTFKEPPVKKAVKKRATAPKTTVLRTRTRTRKNMDLDTKQAGDAKSDNEEGGEKEAEEKNTEKDGEQVKRKREANESDGEEEKKVEEEEAADETDGSELGGFEGLKAKLAASSPAKKKQKKPQTESLTPPPSPKKVRGHGSKGSKGKDTDEDMDINDGEKSSEEPEDEKSDKEKEEKREEATNEKGGKGKKKKVVAKKSPTKAKRVPKAKKSTKEPADPNDGFADGKNGGEQKSATAITKAEAGFIFDMCIADAKWASICETSNKKFGRERNTNNLKKHCLTVMRDRAMCDYPDQ